MFVSLFALYGTSMEGEVSRWWYLYSAVAYFCYRMFDELDGKQARQTKNSTVLGMLLDHGCDAFSCMMLCMTLIKAFQVGNNLLAFFAQVSIMGAFFFIVLEEYYKGYFKLGPLNGVSDASVLIIGIFLLSAVVGYEFWQYQISFLYGYTTSQAFLFSQGLI